MPEQEMLLSKMDCRRVQGLMRFFAHATLRPAPDQVNTNRHIRDAWGVDFADLLMALIGNRR